MNLGASIAATRAGIESTAAVTDSSRLRNSAHIARCRSVAVCTACAVCVATAAWYAARADSARTALDSVNRLATQAPPLAPASPAATATHMQGTEKFLRNVSAVAIMAAFSPADC